MTKELIFKRSDEMWEFVRSNKKGKAYEGFYEIRKLEDAIKCYELPYHAYYEDGGITIIFKHSNGKHVGKARENCYSEGAVMDLLEVFGLYGHKNKIYGGVSAAKAFQMLLDSLNQYTREKGLA